MDRRTVIASAVGVSAAAALAACAPQAPSGTDANSNDAPAENSAPVEVCKTSDIAVGSGKKFDVAGTPVLITHPTQDVFRGFSAVCTHAGFVMNNVSNSEIVCDNHGAVYNADDGSVIKGPAPRALGKVTVTVEGDAVLVSI